MWLLAPFRLVVRSARRFEAEQCAQIAAALSFATLLGLVPMIAAAFALISHMPLGSGLGLALQKFLLANLLPDKAGVIIAKYLGQFAMRAEKATLVGLIFLGATAMIQMLTIEKAFNQIWRVKLRRPLVRRLAMHLTALLLGPVAFGASLAGISYVVGVSLGLVDEPRWVDTILTRFALPFCFMSALFGLLYWAVPNRPVRVWHAAFGGAVASIGFLSLQKLFTLYIAAGFNLNAMVYGAFSAVPVFLVWLYASWSVILIGALLVAELPNASGG